MRSYVSRPWGWYQTLTEQAVNAVKILCVKPGERLSLQTHRKRTEIWFPLDSGLTAQIDENLVELVGYNQYVIPAGVKHRITNDTDREIQIVELIVGAYSETDIVRLEDDYGRS